MKTHVVNTYKISEHPNKSTVIEWVRDNWPDLYIWHEENKQSLESFCDHFHLCRLDFEVSTCSPSYATAILSELGELSGVRLWKYLYNAGFLTAPTGCNNSLLSGGCPFTGYWLDESMLDPLREFVDRPDSRTFQELMNDCLESWVSAYVRDWEDTYSDEQITDHLEANDYHFLEDGSFYE